MARIYGHFLIMAALAALTGCVSQWPRQEQDISREKTAPTEQSATVGDLTPENDEWRAVWRAGAAEGERHIVISGTVDVPSAGYQVMLTPDDDPGNRTDLLVMELNLIKQGGMHAQVITERDVEFEVRRDFGAPPILKIDYPAGEQITVGVSPE